MDSLQWQIFLNDLLWIVPIIIGVICIGIALYTKRKRPPIATVFLCFLMAILTIGVGTFATWRGGLLVYEAIGVAGDISAELMYNGWKLSWWPMIISGMATSILFAIGTKKTYKLRYNPFKKENVKQIVLTRQFSIRSFL